MDLFVFLNNRAFAIAEVKDATTILLAATYQGIALTDVSYKALSMVSHAKVRDVTVRNSASYGLFLSGARQAKVYNVGVVSCATANVLMDNCTECTLYDNDSDFSAADGFHVTASSCCEFRSGNALSNAGYGFYCDANCDYLVISGLNASGNATNFRVFGNNHCLTQSSGDHAKVNGLDIDGKTSKVIGCAFTNSGVDNVHVFIDALAVMLMGVNFNTAGSNEFNNESSTTVYAGTYP